MTTFWVIRNTHNGRASYLCDTEDGWTWVELAVEANRYASEAVANDHIRSRFKGSPYSYEPVRVHEPSPEFIHGQAHVQAIPRSGGLGPSYHVPLEGSMDKKVAETVAELRNLRAALPGTASVAVLNQAISLLSDPAPQVGRMRGDERDGHIATLLEFAEYNATPLSDVGRAAAALRVDLQARRAALATSPQVKCRTTISHGVVGVDDWHQEPCPDCSQPKAASDERLEQLIGYVLASDDLPAAEEIAQRLRQSRDAGVVHRFDRVASFSRCRETADGHHCTEADDVTCVLCFQKLGGFVLRRPIREEGACASTS